MTPVRPAEGTHTITWLLGVRLRHHIHHIMTTTLNGLIVSLRNT